MSVHFTIMVTVWITTKSILRAVWLNLLLIFMSMGFVSHSPPNFESARASFGIEPGPVETHKFGTGPLFAKVNGIMNMVFAYGGAMIFPEFMAEMRRPMDFWKAMVRDISESLGSWPVT